MSIVDTKPFILPVVQRRTFAHMPQGRDGPTSLDRLAAKLSYNWLFDVMPLSSIYQGHAPDKFEPYYKPHQAFVH